MAKLVPLEVAPEELDEEPTQAIPAPEDSSTPVPPAPKEQAAPATAELPAETTYTLPEVPELPIIKEAPKPEPVKPKPKLVPLETAPTEEWKPEEKPGEPTGVGSSFALVRGIAGGLGGSVESAGGTLDVIDALSGGDDTSTLATIGKGLRSAGETMSGGYELQEPSIAGVESVGEFGTYVQEQLGNALGSMASSILAMTAGGAAGGAVGGPAGAAVGAPAAALTQGMWLGVGDMNNSLQADEGVKEALKNGQITREQAAYISLAGGAAIGALDATGILKVTGGAGKAAKELAQDAIKQGVLTAIKKGAFAEGGTEALQEIISQSLQGMTGGNTDLFNRAIAVVDATVGGLLGGGTISGATKALTPEENVEDETTPKADDQPEVAAPTQPEGTPAEVSPAIGTPTPGDTGAKTAPPPAGTEKQPEPPEPEAPVSTEPKPPTPAVARPVTPGVTTLTPGQVSPDVGAAIGTPAAVAEEDVGEFDIEEEAAVLPEGVRQAEVTAHERRIRDMLRAENQRAAEAQKTTVAPANADLNEALAAAAPPPQAELVAPQIPPAVQPVTGETLGTGQALQPAPAADIIAEPVPPPVSEPGGPPVPPTETQEPGPPLSPAPAPTADEALRSRLTPEENAKLDTLRGIAPEPVIAVEPEAAPTPALIPLEVAPIPLTPEEVAAFTPPVARTPGTITLKPAAAEPGAKGAKFKKPKKEPTPKAPELVTTREEAAEAVSGRPEPEAAPQAAPVAKAPRTQLSKDTARHVVDENLRQSTVSEVTGFEETVHDVAAEHVQEHPRGGRSPREYFQEEGPKIAEKVKQRLAAEQEAKDLENIRAEEAVTVAGRKTQAKQAKKQEMAETEVGQKKERAGKKKGKSGAGIRAESEESTYRAYKAALKKKPEEREPALLKWGQLHEKQLKLAKKGAEKERTEIKEQKEIHQEERALAAEARETQGPQLSERAQKAETDSIKAIESVPVPTQTGTRGEQVEKVNDYFARIVKATQKLKLADHHDSTHQSPAENLIIYARKVARNDSSNHGIGPTDFVVARMLYEQGAIDEMNDMVVSQSLEGSGYNEQIGEAPEQAWTETEDEGEIRRHETETGYEMGETEALRRGGRNTAWEQVEGQEQREGEAYRDFREIDVHRPDGTTIRVRAETEKASALLRSLNKQLNESRGGFLSILRNAHIRHLMQMVGDVDVHFIAEKDMAKFGKPGARGVYLNYSDAQRYQGRKPQVFIDNTELLNLDHYTHVLVHELTHAATSQAIRDNVRGTADIIRSMRHALETQLRGEMPEWQIRQLGLKYGFESDAEFIAEAFSNQNFQRLLAKMEVPANIRREIGALGRGRPPTWWQAFTAAVSNAIGMISGQRGQTYMEQVLALSPHITRSVTGQQIAARESVFGKPLPRAVPSSTLDEQMLSREIGDMYQGVKDQLGDRFGGGRRKRDIFATTGEHMRRSVNYFGGPNNVFERLARGHVSRDSIRAKFRRMPADHIDNGKVETANLELKRKQPRQYIEAGRWMDDATRWQVNGTVPLSHKDNSHISKKGFRSADQRSMHAELADRFAKLSPEAQKVIRQNIEHYRQTFEVENDAKIRHSIRQAIKGYHKKLPAGKTIEDAIKWVRSGAAARDAANQTQEDKDYHAALGNTAKTLARIPELRKIKGVYAPMQRRGRYFITATERPFGTMANPLNIPPGATMDAENRLLFSDKKALDAFQDSFPGQVHLSSKWVDATTGAKVNHNEINAVRIYIATVQNKRMEMSDSKSKLAKRAAQLAGEGHQVSAVRISKRDLYQAVEEISPPQIKALIRNLEQTTLGKNTAGQEAVKQSVLDAQVRMLNSPGRLERHLKRRNVLGNETDMAEAMIDYNRTLSSALANYQLGPEMAEADQALEDYINQEAHKDYSDEKTMVRQQMASELRHRIKDTNYVSGGRIMSTVKDITFLRHLFSPHYTLIQLTQPYMMTMPILSSKYGRGAAWQEMMRAYFMGGVRKSLGRGFKETWKAGAKLWPGSRPKDQFSYDEMWRDIVKGQKDEALLNRVFDQIIEMGFGASAGIEAQEISEQGKTVGEKALGRIVDMARALPESAESVNRYTTAIATLRLAKRKGLSDDLAIREAVLTVEETQGGYGAANNPVFFNNPYLAPAVQFRKFSLAYGQLYYRNLAWAFSHADPEQRKIARKSVAKLSVATIAAAGAYGLAPVEIARSLANVAAMLGLKDDDWEEDENQIQVWVAELLKSTGVGEEISEALFRGAPRIANLDLSGSLGVDNLAMFGQPKELSAEGLMEWFAKAYTGASGAIFFKSIDAVQDGNFTDAIPWPKVGKNIHDAVQLATKGTVDKKTGEQYMEPVGVVEAVYKGLGFRTASEAREWEAGGGGYEQREERETRHERRQIMATWANASPAEKQRIFREDVKQWNKEHPDRSMRIDMGDLQRSKKERIRQRKEREKERQK